MSDLRAITLHQPWASLVALGVKTIETRSWPCPPGLIGEPLLIHAGARLPEMGWEGGGWSIADEYRDSQGSRFMYRESLNTRVELPLGVVVASCHVTACVPIMAGDECEEADLADLPNPRIESYIGDDEIQPDGDLLLYESANDESMLLSNQAPFGDFSPGRYAWLLDDVQPTTSRCPRCWHEAASQALRPRATATRRKLARHGIPVGSDDATVQALGAPPLHKLCPWPT